MAEPVLSFLFGPGASQTSTELIIQKSSLYVTADANNRGEQLFAGVCKRAADRASQIGFDTNPEQSILILPGFDTVIYRTIDGESKAFLQQQLVINFVKEQASAGINPDDY